VRHHRESSDDRLWFPAGELLDKLSVIHELTESVALLNSIAVQVGRGFGPAVKSFHPGDKLAAACVAIVNHQPWPMPLDLGERQLYWLGIEFRIIQKSQFAEPAEASAASEKPRKPIRNRDAHYTLTTACIENNGVERVQRSTGLRTANVAYRPTLLHIE
jgi:hypothetical protein